LAARRIVEDHHGRIEVESSTGKGTTFSFILPMWHVATLAMG
jgi:signal transduction histidine kinase